MILERSARDERSKVREHLGDARAGHVLGEIEPVRAEVGGHVRRAGALGQQPPAR